MSMPPPDTDLFSSIIFDTWLELHQADEATEIQFHFHSINGENAHYGTPTNPCAPDRVPGGSSSGSAVAVGAKLVDFALGQQSLHQPLSWFLKIPDYSPCYFLIDHKDSNKLICLSFHFPSSNVGTDTGGSVRVPAAYCGIFGLRPSHGLVSTENVIPMSQMFDTVGG